MRVRPPASDGAANEALCRLLAGELKLPRSAVALERGASARLKLVRLEGVSSEALRRRWPGLALPDEAR